MTQKAPSMQYKISHLVLWRYCLRRFCPRGNDGPKKFLQVVTRVLAICRSFKPALMFSFTMLIECSSTQLKNLQDQTCTIIFFKLFTLLKVSNLKFLILICFQRKIKNFQFQKLVGVQPMYPTKHIPGFMVHICYHLLLKNNPFKPVMTTGGIVLYQKQKQCIPTPLLRILDKSR